MEASNVPVATSNTPTTVAVNGEKTTFVPTVAAPTNFKSSVSVPVETEESKVPVATSYVPTTFAL
eukprot:1017796-Prymnesium_polylepis.2